MKTIIITTMIILLVQAISFLAYRAIQYNQREGFRQGVSLLKEGNYQGAREKLLISASEGNSVAKELLAEMYAFGEGVEQSREKALSWARKAECNCEEPANVEFYIASSFLEGSQVPKDEKEALYWLNISAGAGNQKAIELLEKN